ncbi:MAG: protein-tyrosine-phosphatase [Crocinitomicaceae bacterium]|nr:protein-tyrosine-phosphatase [Crocinitomicaceae bacterium]
MGTELSAYISLLIEGAEHVLEERRLLLDKLVEYIRQHKNDDQVNLNFICIHNSRRSHLAQVWAQIAAHYYGLNQIKCYSGGTEATAIYPSIIETLRDNGITIDQQTLGENPVYEIKFDVDAESITGFSKKYDDAFNPDTYAAVMVCSEAGEMCPFIPEASARLVIPYDDPKQFDDTPIKKEKYQERSTQIGTEMFYVFSRI